MNQVVSVFRLRIHTSGWSLPRLDNCVVHVGFCVRRGTTELTLPETEICLTNLEGFTREGYILRAAILRWIIARDALCAAVLYTR